jgi:outer membrane biosynthesis protein TonB
LIVDKDGAVFAALVDEPGPSRYFERLAIEAAKKWTFPPMPTTTSRLERVRFDFTRAGATGHAVEIE